NSNCVVPFRNRKVHKLDLLHVLPQARGNHFGIRDVWLARRHESESIGVSLAIFSTVIWAGYWTLNIRDTRDPLIGMSLNFLIAAPVVMLLWWFFDGAIPPVEGLLGGLYIGLFEMSLAFFCWSLALKSTNNAATISNLVFLSPFLSLQFIQWFLGESIHATTYGGLVMIIAGIGFQQLMHRRHPSSGAT
ncbi:MAG: EamA family transporter, partial [Pseudomonadales bacterium]